MAIPPELRTHAEGQHGLLTRRDLAARDISRGRRLGMVDRGELVPVRPQVFRVGGAPITLHQRVLAVCLDREASASHRTAAWLHGIDGFPPPRRIEVLARRPKVDARDQDALVHTTAWLPNQDLVLVQGIPTLAVARTVLTLAGLVPHELPWATVKSAVDQACRDGLATDPWLWWRLEQLRRSGRNGVRTMEAILDARRAGDVTESWLEAETMAVLRRFAVPLPRCQARIAPRGSFVARVDFVYDGPRVIVEVAGHRPHKSKVQAQRDAERTRALVLAGFTVLPFTYDDVVSSPSRLAAQILDALAHRHAA